MDRPTPPVSLVLPILLALGGAANAQEEPDPLPTTEAAISSRDLRSHVEFLASDELRGREAGTPDAARAARYLAHELEHDGLRPGVPEGFLQPVPLTRFEADGPPELVLRTSGGAEVRAQSGVDFSLRVRGEPDRARPLRVVLVRSAEELPAEPDPEAALLFDGSSSDRRAWLAARGQEDGAGWGLLVRFGPSTAGRPRTQGASSGLRRAGEEGPDTVMLRGPLQERVRAGEFSSLELRVPGRRVEVTDHNVVGILPGVGTPEHPELANQAIVFSAHYDHLGVAHAEDVPEGAHASAAQAPEGAVAAAVPQDLIYNGADDDASGTATVLELAEAFAAQGPPARTLVFLLAGGEEEGLLGTSYYLDHPAVPLERTLFDLNFEMLGRPDELAGGAGHLWITGADQTSLAGDLRTAGHPFAADPRPSEHFYQRSDNYAFVQRHVMGQTLSSYDLHEDYHRPSDEVTTLDLAHMEGAAREAFEAARLLASGAVTPAWSPPLDAAPTPVSASSTDER